ncbi:hypothetical protein ACU11_08045 [Xanthomonas oryzae pv. oryzicola]|nr:hypothetical protein ACU11_08045 [Xanthomonas oryzae pv. oryzicola]
MAVAIPDSRFPIPASRIPASHPHKSDRALRAWPRTRRDRRAASTKSRCRRRAPRPRRHWTSPASPPRCPTWRAWNSTRMRRQSTCACSKVVSANSSANASPPRRAGRSEARAVAVSSTPTSCSTASPLACE